MNNETNQNSKRGAELLHDPSLNKSTAYTEAERQALGSQLRDEKYLFLGAGSAAIGLANLLCTALVEQGMTLKDAQARVSMFDINGLLEPTRTDLVDFQKPYAHPHPPTKDFLAALESIKPTTIIRPQYGLQS